MSKKPAELEDLNRCIELQAPPSQWYGGMMFVGEAPGEQEQASGTPFVGAAGKLFDQLLVMAGIERAACVITNVFHIRPPFNRVNEFFTSDEKDTDYPKWPMEFPRRYLRRELSGEIVRLTKELQDWSPKMVVAMGNVALWALTGKSGITVNHGKLLVNANRRIIPVFHPAFLLRSHSQRHTDEVVKALRLAKELCS